MVMMIDKEIIDKQRQAFKEFMQRHKLKAFSWAKKAGLSEATIRNYLSGRNQSLTSVNLEKLANVEGVKVQNLIDSESSNFGALEDRNIGSGYINKALLVQSFIDVEEYIIEERLELSARERANILIAWYELAQMIKKENLSFSSSLSIKDFIRSISASA